MNSSTDKRQTIAGSPVKFELGLRRESTETEDLSNDGGLIDLETAFLSKLSNMNQKVRLYKKLFYNKEPFYDANAQVKKHNDRMKKQ